jgi:flagellin
VADASGTNHNVTITFTKSGDPNTFTYAVTSSDATVAVSGGSGAITFDATTGKETAVTGDPVTYTATGAGTFSPFSFALDFSKMTAGTTEVAAVATDATSSLNSASSSQNALTAINKAITSVAADRGTIGANINTLTAVKNVMTTQSTNTLAAENDVTATDYGQATSDMSKYQILSQTGIAALSQANQSQQLITKLLQ